MSLALLVYLIYSISGLKLVISIITVLSFCVLFVSSGIRLAREDYSWYFDRAGKLKEDVKQFRSMIDKLIKYSFISLLVSAFLVAIIPSERTAWLMVGAYAGQKIAENEKVQELSGKVITIIESKINEYATEKGKQ